MNTKGLESAIRLNRILMGASIKAGNLTPTQIIACDGLVEDWTPGNYAVDDVRNYNGQTWRCCQAHDSTSSPDWAPGAVAALWAPYHASEAAYARPWTAPTGAHDAYQSGEVMVWTDGATYQCKQDATVHDPDTLPTAWELIAAAPVATTTSILDGMTVAQLKEYAANNNIDITGLTLKADIRAAIEAAEAQNGEG